MRIVVDAALRVGDSDHPQRLDRALAGLARARSSDAAGRPRAIWLPIVKTGLSEVIGSWKIIAILRAANRAHLGLGQLRQVACPRRESRRRQFAPLSGSRRMIDSTEAVLPEPDSPTIPISLPGSTEKLTPSTARTSPSSVKNEVREGLYFEQGRHWGVRVSSPMHRGPDGSARGWVVACTPSLILSVEERGRNQGSVGV